MLRITIARDIKPAGRSEVATWMRLLLHRKLNLIISYSLRTMPNFFVFLNITYTPGQSSICHGFGPLVDLFRPHVS